VALSGIFDGEARESEDSLRYKFVRGALTVIRKHGPWEGFDVRGVFRLGLRENRFGAELC